MTHASLRSSLFALLPIIALLACAPFAAAESVLWNKTEPALELVDSSVGDSYWRLISGDSDYSVVSGPNVTITYYTEVTNADTGAVIKCGSSVPNGTRMTFRFIPHASEHVYWFATGYLFDSPYGDWVDGAQKPYADMCSSRKSKDFVGTYTTTGRQSFDMRGSIYTSLSVNPPEKTLTLSSLLTCTGAETTRTCTASQTGIAENTFEFGETSARYYSSTNITDTNSNSDFNRFNDPRRCYTSNQAMLESSPRTPYVLQVPAQSISCPITITESNQPPMKPIVSGSCVVGQPSEITFSSTDPDGRKLRYGIDWDNDGSVDQFVPPSGYVDSGIAQSASRTYTTSGQKTIRVLAQNDQGSGSPWTTYSFICSNNNVAACPTGYVRQGTSCVRSNLCTTPPHCSGNDLVNSCTGALIRTCDRGCSAGACNFVPAPSGTINANPTLLRIGKTSVISWSASNVSACTVTGTNGDSWTGKSSSGKLSKPIQSQTTYFLRCDGYAGANPASIEKNVIINIIPVFQEK